MTDIAKEIVAGLWIVLWGYWLVSAVGTKKTLWRKGRLGFQIWYRVAIIVLVVVISNRPDLWQPLVHGRLLDPTLIGLAVGVAICALGIGFAIWARVNIGRNWGMPMTVRENPDLVTSGPYGIVRNPIYSGILLAEFGSALVMGNSWLLCFAICVPYFAYSASQEEKLMAEQFPDQYPEYKSRTKTLIPYVW